MKKIILLFIITLSCCLNIKAGNLNKWTNYNFQGVWEITSTDSYADLSWLIRNIVGNTIGNAAINKVEIALDYNGWGYLAFYSGENAGKCDIRGRIYTPHFDDNYYDCLSLLCANDYTQATYGFISVNVSAYNGDASDKDAFAIHSVNGICNAKAIRTSTIYIPDAVSEIASPSILVQFQEDGISVVNADNSSVSVFDMDGILMYQVQNYAGETIKLPKGVCYIIKVNDSSMKIML